MNEVLMYAFNGGNGSVKGLSNNVDGPVSFESVTAPITNKKGLRPEDEHPTFSLCVDGQSYVFGLDDVFAHGRRDKIQRHNSLERYVTAEYFRLLKVLFMHAFPTYVNSGKVIMPVGIVSLPISEYNKDKVREEVKTTLVGEHEIIDHAGNTLYVRILADKIDVTAESTGDLYHWVYSGHSAEGTQLIVDIGYETTDCSLFENGIYQRDRAMTIPRTGMGNVARGIHDYLGNHVRGADITRIDRSMRGLAGKGCDQRKIEVAPGVAVDVREVYDFEIDQLSTKIANGVSTFYTEDVTQVIVAGGGAYHQSYILQDKLPFDNVAQLPESEFGDIMGMMAYLTQATSKKKKK